MKIQEKSNRVRFEWADESRTRVISVQDDDGPFIIYSGEEVNIRYWPKTQLDFLTEAADRGEIPAAHDPSVESEWCKWTRGVLFPGKGFVIDGQLFKGPNIQILDRWYFNGTHSCPKRMVVNGFLHTIPCPIDPPLDDDEIHPRPVFGGLSS